MSFLREVICVSWLLGIGLNTVAFSPFKQSLMPREMDYTSLGMSASPMVVLISESWSLWSWHCWSELLTNSFTVWLCWFRSFRVSSVAESWVNMMCYSCDAITSFVSSMLKRTSSISIIRLSNSLIICSLCWYSASVPLSIVSSSSNNYCLIMWINASCCCNSCRSLCVSYVNLDKTPISYRVSLYC